jgi:hypothetical protein
MFTNDIIVTIQGHLFLITSVLSITLTQYTNSGALSTSLKDKVFTHYY